MVPPFLKLLQKMFFLKLSRKKVIFSSVRKKFKATQLQMLASSSEKSENCNHGKVKIVTMEK